MNNGSLHIEAIVGSDAANYTCRATNIYGSDEITFAISVQGKWLYCLLLHLRNNCLYTC